jgi:adenylate cyclase, class 2
VNGAVEVEVKFPVADIDKLRARLLEVGAHGDEEVFEDNLLLDDADESLRRRGEMLRLRRGRHVTLTHKSPMSAPGFKARLEREVQVDDFDGVFAIFQAIGYRSTVRYQKYRQTFTLDVGAGDRGDSTVVRSPVVITLDRLSFGTFCEIEGDPAAIEVTADLLGLRLSDASAEDYLALWKRLGQESRSAIGGLVFADRRDETGLR